MALASAALKSDFDVHLNVLAPQLWSLNAVLNGVARNHDTGTHIGTLSIKSVVRGKCRYQTPDGTHTITPSEYLILNESQTYRMEAEGPSETETLAIFFQPGFVESVRSAEQTLDPDLAAPTRFELCERLEFKDGALAQKIARLKALVHDPLGDRWETQETFYALAVEMLRAQGKVSKQANELGYARESVRTEVFRRLGKSREVMMRDYGSQLDLSQLAEAAALSPSHFHSLFRKAFGITPHEFLTDVRVRNAVRLLRTTNWPNWLIALNVGFASEHHFCRLVRRHTGQTPNSLRNS